MTRFCFAIVLICLPFVAAFAQLASPGAIDRQFRKVLLETNCADPMEISITPDERVIFVERSGSMRIWKPDTKATVTAARFSVNFHRNPEKGFAWEDGLIGLTLDPGFASNHWLFVYYSPTNASENRVSRFTLDGDTLAMATEKIILRVATERDVCCHAGGSLAFDGDGNLFVSTGDNTNPFESDGFDPIDYRPDRHGFDAARSSGNTADLRGKILRIHPEPDGSYTVPNGNLFAPGTPQTRPEIYVMGCRNPFRITIDRPSGTLYWGEVGPDAQAQKPERGPAGFDEFNRTRVAGNFGWPFIIADNKPYRAYDFASRASGEAFDPQHPQNLSQRNTGLKELPPAQPAWIWYPYAPSIRFPAVGSGARTACAGPVYHFADSLRSPHKLPKQFDNILFLYDWARNWLMAVKLDVKGDIVSMRPFVPQLKFKKPIDLELGPDGCLYLIEFGTNWEANKDSQVVKLEWESE